MCSIPLSESRGTFRRCRDYIRCRRWSINQAVAILTARRVAIRGTNGIPEECNTRRWQTRAVPTSGLQNTVYPVFTHTHSYSHTKYNDTSDSHALPFVAVWAAVAVVAMTVAEMATVGAQCTNPLAALAALGELWLTCRTTCGERACEQRQASAIEQPKRMQHCTSRQYE